MVLNAVPLGINSNTTLVKVKLGYSLRPWSNFIIQIQHLLKLNSCSHERQKRQKAIQIQHLLKLNFVMVLNAVPLGINSNTTLVKVK